MKFGTTLSQWWKYHFWKQNKIIGNSSNGINSPILFQMTNKTNNIKTFDLDKEKNNQENSHLLIFGNEKKAINIVVNKFDYVNLWA